MLWAITYYNEINKWHGDKIPIDGFVSTIKQNNNNNNVMAHK